ncbi:MAG: nucleotide sugar dehydrogenase [Pelagibacteraceae bacterium]|jgi:UDP-N-acetyl-D-mannosaminuronic acid dehydrogenase|nr:nucleotide sugar dehydrogenase [Pelagibacteraceae bacterium]
MFKKKYVCIVGGAGHIGTPLGLALCSKGYNVILIDKHTENIKKINQGIMPFVEEGCAKLLRKMIKKKKIFATNKLDITKKCKYIIVCLGTPVDNKFNPNLKNFISFFYNLRNHLKKNHIVIIRSSIYPGICNKVFNIIKNHCKNLSYCPERIAQGKSLIELPQISQIISGKSVKARLESGKIFRKICKKIIYTKIIEAELIKLFSNAYRYINFSISNQFYLMCQNQGLDFYKIRNIMRDNYKRNTNIPTAGFTAGPCLLKDTMQLSSFYRHKFSLLSSAMSINEGLPKFMFKKLNEKYNLKNKTIGILGLSFKAENDDIRDSLSIKLLKYIKSKKIKTLQSDEYYKDKNNIDKNTVVKKSDIIIIATPHKAYKKMRISKNKILVDIWGLIEKK